MSVINKFWKLIHFRNLAISVIVGLLFQYINWKFWPHSKFIEEFIIVFIAAFTVSAYFEFYLRRGISEENMKMYEMKEELGKAGVSKYYPNFKDIHLRSYFTDDIKFIDIYVHFADSIFNQISDEIYKFLKVKGNVLNIYILSPNNKFISGLGEFWGHEEDKYNEAGIKSKIKSSQDTLNNIFNQLNNEGTLLAKITVSLLKRNPVFYSFYRFDDIMIYVPSKIVTPRIIIPPAFQLYNTHNDIGLYNKCMNELNYIKGEKDSLEIYLNN